MKVNTSLRGLPCIYKIKNLVNNKIYIGKTKCLLNRSYNYNSSFKQERHDHINDYLFNEMIKYGYENFILEPMEFCAIDELAEKELFWIKELKSNERKFGYNLRLDSSTGMQTAKETSVKIMSNLLEQWETGVRSGHSRKMKESWARTPERRQEVSELFTKVKTKFAYLVTNEKEETKTCSYKQLKELKLDKVLCKFWKRKIDKVFFKGFYIERIEA